jgi:hypothetical protein
LKSFHCFLLSDTYVLLLQCNWAKTVVKVEQALNRKTHAGIMAVPLHMQLVASFSPHRPGFTPSTVYEGFGVDKVTLGQVFLQVLHFPPVNTIPPMFHIYFWGMDNGHVSGHTSTKTLSLSPHVNNK